MKDFLPVVVVFFAVVSVLELIFYAFRVIHGAKKERVRSRIKSLSKSIKWKDPVGIRRSRILSHLPMLNRLLLRVPLAKRLDLMVQQANAARPVGLFLLLSPLLALLTLYFTHLMTKNMLFSAGFGGVGGAIPWVYLLRKRKKRVEKFIAQLADGAQLIARAMRAGHAFSTGLQMAAAEFDDPLGTEFEYVVDQINFGVPTAEALKNLARRIDCDEAKFFAVSVILQRETGGNLAEILDTLASLIRERHKLKGKIRTLSAEGRLSAIGLVCMPMLVTIALYFFNREYILFLLEDPVGKIMSMAALTMMAIGVIFIRRMINFEI
ncbi:MAG: type II secretion system F family protein [Desulfobacterales bacterium]|nr:MAG: type II secretion system F family protein [Desulfobacterales bacterium]